MSQPHRAALACALILGGLVVAWTVYHHPPSQSRFYPPCALYQLTGLYCPGCGGTRCLYAWLHLDLVGAARMNLLTTVALPLLALMGLSGLWRWVFPPHETRPPHGLPGWAAGGIALVILMFAVLRNLPWPPFNWLAPH